MGVRITVPATSANIGIGYDCLGMAMTLHATFDFARADALRITGCPEEFQNERNLVYRSFVLALAHWGEEPFPIAIDMDCPIPIARGLGSSSACTVAGIMGAASLTGRIIRRDEAVAIATEMEGHPDNVAPAIMGSLVCSFMPESGVPECIRYEVNRKLHFVTVVPPYEVHTADARKVVPTKVDLSTAVWQMGRISGLTRGLESGDAALISSACHDRLQEPFRKALIPDYQDIRDTCMDGGALAMWISGSGSTMMAAIDDGLVAESLRARIKAMHPDFDVSVLDCDPHGVRIEMD
ncbi:homoserine kinase [Slackia sp. CM382]|uniref:homoserine kinase n=1 Tax=Slackia TaxID=84108 RepID=UPI00027C4FA8|nr:MULTISPECIES: homoserine kinase [Slackia]EJU32796.1 homoserine kinase [Slackia sp. CM382]MCK6139428.1 homoserine kinase [Slackia exigua]